MRDGRLDLAVIGNSRIGALIDARGSIMIGIIMCAKRLSRSWDDAI